MVSSEHVGTSQEELARPNDAHQAITVNQNYRIIHIDQLGDFLINSHDTMIEANLRGSLQEIADLQVFARGLVLDIGANVGGHAVAFARTAQMVCAFEPQPHSFHLLCANAAINGCTNIVPIHCALGSKEGTAAISPIDPEKEHVSQGAFIGEQGVPVQMKTLDSFKLSTVAFMKIDVEGYELDVLQGATETLEHDRPLLYVEIHREALIPHVTAFLEALGYEYNERIVQYTPAGVSTRGYLFWIPGRLVFV